MSGTVPQMPMAQGAAPQIPPQVLAALMAAHGQAPMQDRGAVPQMPMNPQAQAGAQPTLPSVQGIPPPVGSPNAAMFGRAAAGRPGAPQGRFTPAEMAHLGRFGDSVIAHLTPGEVEVPPQVQTPKLMGELDKAFQHAGVSPAQFTAGSPASSHNPMTGAPEYNFLSALLPAVLGVGGAFLGPLVAPALGIGAGLGSAIGGGLGTFAGGLASGQSPAASALGGLGAGAGSYLLGNLLGGAGGAGGTLSSTPPATMQTAPFQAGTINSAAGTAQPVSNSLANAIETAPATQAAGTSISSAPAGLFGTGVTRNQLMGTLLGGYLGGQLAPDVASPLPPGFSQGMPPINPQFGQLIGSNVQNTPTFQGYSPYQAMTGIGGPAGYTFYPVAGESPVG